MNTSVHKYFSENIEDDVMSDILLELSYDDLLKFIDVDDGLINYIHKDSFWKRYIKNFTLHETLKNDYFILLYYKIKFNTEKFTENNLLACVKHGSYSCLKVLLCYSKLNPAFQNSRLIREACRLKNHEMVKLLLCIKKIDPH